MQETFYKISVNWVSANMLRHLKIFNKRPETFSLEYTQQGTLPQAEISRCIQRPKYAQSCFLGVTY